MMQILRKCRWRRNRDVSHGLEAQLLADDKTQTSFQVGRIREEKREGVKY
jgi:hypothetical protein